MLVIRSSGAVYVTLFLYSIALVLGQDRCSIGSYRSKIGPWNECSGFKTCEQGSYCTDGFKYDCPAGTYGNRFGLSNSSCAGPCPSGHYCPPKTINPDSYRCGSSHLYCPESSSTPQNIPPGFYGIGTSEDLNFNISICPKGFYCNLGKKHVCSNGTYGSTEGLSTHKCSGTCPEGWYCPTGSIFPKEYPCRKSSEEYCPPGSNHPLHTPSGYYTIHSHIPYGGGYGGIEICPPGAYCSVGTRYLCPEGRYGVTEGSVNSSCTGVCRAGYYCPAGSTKATERECGHTSLFCPIGSAFPIMVTPGYFTTGSDNISHSITSSSTMTTKELWYFDPNTRTSQSICEPGHYCQRDGVSRKCPPGYFGSSFGLQNSICN
eukprot:gene8856-18351_t